MKKLSMFLIGLMTVSVLAMPSDAPVVKWQEIDRLQKEMMGEAGLVIHVPADTTLGLQLDLGGDFVEGETETVKLAFSKSLFIFFSPDPEKAPQFSWNKDDWKGWEDMFGGSLSVGFDNLTEPLKLNLELHSK